MAAYITEKLPEELRASYKINRKNSPVIEQFEGCGGVEALE